MDRFSRGLFLIGFLSLAVLTAVVAVGTTSPQHAAAVSPGFSIVTNPPLDPPFNPAITDYAVRCTGGPTTSVSTTGSDTVTFAGTTFAGPANVIVPMVAGQGMTVTDGASSYEIRCLPSDFPTYTSSVTGTPQANGYFLTIGHYSIVFDNQGVPVWWYQDPGYLSPFDAKFFSPTTVAYWDGPTTSYELRGLDGSLQGHVGGGSFPLDFHELQQLPNGNYLGIMDLTTSCPAGPTQCLDLSSWGRSAQSPVDDNVIVELSPSNQLVWWWSAAQHLDLAAENVNWRDQYPDVIHMNSLEYDGNGGIIFSARHLDAVYRIDMATGNVTWKLGGTPTPESLSVSGDPYLAAGGQLFSGQHYARLLPDGSLSIHDNGSRANRAPRAVRFTINTSNMTATEVEQVTDSRATFSPYTGSAEKLPGGDWVADWGGGDFTTELNAQGVPQLTITYPGPLFNSYRSGDVLASVAAMRAGMDAMNPPVTATPSTAVVTPSGGATVSGTQGIDASATPGVTQVQYELSGGGLSNDVIATASPTWVGWLASWDTTGVPNGTYTLQSVATYPGGGLSGTSPGVSITVNNPTPTTSVVLPSAGATLSGSVYLDAAASAGTSQVTYELTGNGLNNDVIATAVPTIYGWFGVWDTTAVPNGSYTLQSVATTASLGTVTSPPVTITVNNGPPTTTVGLPGNGATVSGSQWLDAGASPGVASVKYVISGGPNNLVDTLISGSTPTYIGWIGAWNSTTVPNGTYTLQSVATYAGGVNGTSPGITITVSN
jgi:hypothetical protein